MTSSEQAPVCVIGAGFAGLAAMRELQDQGEPFIAFERRSCVGGLWNYERSGLPSLKTFNATFCETAVNPIYSELVTNLPKDCMNFADFPYEESVPEYPHMHHTHVLDYVQRFVKAHKLEQAIEFHTIVACVSWNDDIGLWEVQTHCKGATRQRYFKAVIVASGHYGYPIIPPFRGIENFPGHVIHSCQFDDVADFQGKRVLVIGGSVSAGQIAELLFSSGFCTSVHLSSRRRDGFTFAGTVGKAEMLGVSNFGALEALLPNGAARFTSGDEVQVDIVISATGYAFRYPFLDEKALDLREDDNRSLKHLYKGLWYAPRPSLSFLGMPINVLGPAQVFEHQARAVVSVIQGRAELPALHAMEDNSMDLRVSLGLETEAYCKSLALLSGTECTYTGTLKGASEVRDVVSAMAKYGNTMFSRL